MLQKELGTLESLRQFLPDGLLDNPGTCESDQRLRLCQYHVAQHGETGRHASGRRIRQYADIEKPCVAMTLEGSRSLRHLHQGRYPLLHPGAPGAREDNHRKFFFGGSFYRAGNLLAHHFAHAGHEKTSVADAKGNFGSMNTCFSCNDSLVKTRLFLKYFQFLFVSFVIQRIPGGKSLIPLFERVFIRYHLYAAVCVDTEISSAFWTDIIVLFHILCKNGTAALIAFAQKPFRNFRLRSTQRNIIFPARRKSGLFKHVV